MIRYPITEAQLRAEITKLDANWFATAAGELAVLPANPASSDFKPLWSKIKQVYIDLQCSKCCFCEKPLEGKIEQDVEHFRPKTEVKHWKVPAKLVAEGIVVQQPANGASEPGYAQLAFQPFNYATACKTCNSTLKGNIFPIEGTRDSAGVDPGQMSAERALFIYPIGTIDADPEQLIEFDGLSPVPKNRSGFLRRRAVVTIEVFRLDSPKLRTLFKQRAYLVRQLYLELEGEKNAPTNTKRTRHRNAIDVLTSPQSPFTNCLRSFERLYAADPIRADAIADACVKFMKSKSL